MTVANGSRHSMAYILESTFGTTPATPTFDNIRHDGTSLGLNKDSLQSNELRDDRQISDFRGGNKNIAGDTNIELSYGTFDDFIEATLGGTWTTEADTGTTTISSTATTFTRGSGSFVTDGFTVGDIVNSLGFADADNNGKFIVTAVAALTLTVTALEGQTTTVEAGDGDEQIISYANIQVGVTRRSFTIERFFADIIQYHRFTGCNFNTLSLSVAPNAMVTGVFGVVGKGMSTDSSIISGATYNAATTTSPFDSFTGTINEAQTAIAVVTGLNLSLDNGMTPLFVVGSPETLEPSIARSNLTGSLTALFENSTLLDKFINETESSISFSLVDTAGNSYIFTIPRIKYSTGQPDVADEGVISITFDFQALLSSSYNTNFMIERIPA